MIFTFEWRLALIATPGSAPYDTAEVLQFSKTVAEDTGMSVYQNSEAASVYRCHTPNLFGVVLRIYLIFLYDIWIFYFW